MRSYVSGTGCTLLQFVGLRVEILGQPQAAFTLICAADCRKGAIPLGQFPKLGGIAHSRFVPKLSQQIVPVRRGCLDPRQILALSSATNGCPRMSQSPIRKSA